MDKITLLIASDDAFAMPMTVALHSALRHLPQGLMVEIFIVDGGITSQNRAKIVSLLKPVHAGAQLHFKTLDLSRFAGSNVGRLTLTSLARIFVAEIVPPQTERALYLDCDIVVTGDLSALWKIDMTGVPLMVAQDVHFTHLEIPIDGAEPRVIEPYFNSGVILFNLPEWTRQGLQSKTTEYLEEYGAVFKLPDQDALNAACSGVWQPLEPHWNMQLNNAKTILDTPGITHYTVKKPWQWRYRKALAWRFFEAYYKSGWDKPIVAIAVITRLFILQGVWRLSRRIGRGLRRIWGLLGGPRVIAPVIQRWKKLSGRLGPS